MDVLEVKDVKKRIGKREIIKGISFSVKEGEVFGFLGPNGAGKTTTIRMMVGLIAPNSGNISIMGHDIKKEREEALNEVGAVVENPELYTYLSGMENLRQIASIRKVPKAQIDEYVNMVNLSGRINDKVRKYSLGMKQRLGLAAAMMANPKLLILDEPTNGLDPSGIMDFRSIVKKAAKERGMSVFVSSHILSEVQQLCDTVAFIAEGEIKSIESVSGDTLINNKQQIILVSSESAKCAELIGEIEEARILRQEEGMLTLLIKNGFTPELIFKLAEAKLPISQVYEKHAELEARYIELVEGGKR